MNKNEILTLIIVGVIILAGAGVGGFFLTHNFGGSSSSESSNTNSGTTDQKVDDTFIVNGYTLKYGKYASADRDAKGNRQVQTVVFLNKDNFIAQGETVKYSVENDRIKLSTGLTYQVIGDNKLLFEAGAGIELTYQEN